MNELLQQDSLLIGSQEDIIAITNKTSARLLVFGDSHGNVEVVSEIIAKFGMDADALIYCGDGFSDLVACIEQAAHDEKLKNAFPPVIIAVKGNGDASMYSAYDREREDDSHYALNTRISCNIAGRGIFVTHGDHYRVDMGVETLVVAAQAVDADMVFFGHTHRTYWEESGGTLLLNPGSCSSSRSALPPSFAMVSFPGKQDRFKIEYYGIEKALFKGHKFFPLSVHMS